MKMQVTVIFLIRTVISIPLSAFGINHTYQMQIKINTTGKNENLKISTNKKPGATKCSGKWFQVEKAERILPLTLECIDIIKGAINNISAGVKAFLNPTVIESKICFNHPRRTRSVLYSNLRIFCRLPVSREI